ncbi:MAG: hypothetical protein K2P74_04530 [Nitrosomonas sp.]|nr:hypothetical protein [Nitrosomonas sp.]
MKRIFNLWIIFSISNAIVTLAFDMPVLNIFHQVYWAGVMVFAIWIDKGRIFNDNNLD